MVKAILFDMGGVVIDSETIWDVSQKVFLDNWNIIYERDKLKHLLTGKSMEDGIKVMQEMYPQIKGTISELIKLRLNIVNRLFANEIKFIPGFLDFRKFIADNYKICIATAMGKDLLNKVNNKLNLNEIFNDCIFSIDDVGGKSKPNPDVFLLGAKNLGVDIKNCIVIEDAPSGIAAANNANIFCIGITTTYDRSKLKGANLIVDSFKEIEDFLKNK